MGAKTFEIIQPCDIQSFSFKVSEQITQKNLLEYIRTNLFQTKAEFSKGSRFYYYFIQEAFTYEVLVYESKGKKETPIPFIFSSLTQKGLIQLFITQDYFCLFQSHKLLLYKKIENISQEDILQYVEQLYRLKVDHATFISQENLEELKTKFTQNIPKKSFQFYPLQKDNSFIFFLFFICFVGVVFIGNIINLPKKTLLNQTPIAIKLPEFTSLSVQMVELLEYLKNENILIEKIEYKNRKFYTKLTNKSRKKLLLSVSKYQKNIVVNTIQYEEKTKQYSMDVTIEI